MSTKNKPKPVYSRSRTRRPLTAELEHFVKMDEAAHGEGLTWNQWALAILLSKIHYKQREEKAGHR